MVFVFACANSEAKTTATPDKSLPNCIQVYIDNPALPGTQEQCQQSWDYFVKHKNYYAMAIMIFDGLGGQNPDLKKALAYAKQIDLNANIDPDVGPIPYDDSKTNLISTIEDAISNPAQAKSAVSDCGLMSGTTIQDVQCSGLSYQNSVDKTTYDNDLLAKKLPPQQAQALTYTLDSYLTFLSDDNDFRDTIGEFQGSGRSIWSYNSQQVMLDFYNHAMNNLLNHYPDALKTKLSEKALDSQLNKRYITLIREIDKIPANYIDGTPKEIKKKLITTERDWLQYKNAYVNFAVLYYADKYKSSDITQITTAYLTRRRLAEINDQISTVSFNLNDVDVDNWYKHPS